MKLKDCLEERGYWELRLMARQLQLSLSGKHPPKGKVVEALLGFLHEPTHIDSLLRRLGEQEREALDALIAAGGSLPWALFGERFGQIRPWRAGASGQSTWAAQSSAEMLAYLGLIFRTPRRPKPGQEVTVLIAHDLLLLLPTPKPLALSSRSALSPRSSGDALEGRHSLASEGALRHDVTLLLSFVHREQVRARYKGRWFSPKDLQRLNERLMVPEDLTNVRSELQSGRIRFLHFLAESAGLMEAQNGHFALTPLAWQWLEATGEAQDEQLWQAWQAETSEQTERWRRYRLVGSEQDAPLALLGSVLRQLVGLTVQQRLDIDAFKERLVAQDATWWHLTTWWEEEEGRHRSDEFIDRLFSEMLSWWEVLQVEGERFALTAKGAWLLGNRQNEGERRQASNAHQGFEIADTTLPEQLTVNVSLKSATQALVRLEALAEWVGRTDDDISYHLTPKSLANAIERGSQFNEILAFLDRESGGLTEAQVDKLKQWSQKIADVHLHHVTLLETRSPERMTEITRPRQVRQHILRTLNPRTVIVNEAKLQDVTRYLRRQGISLIAPPDEAKPKTPSDFTQGAASLLICARVYQALAQWLDLPQPLPSGMLNNLAAHLDSATQSAAQQASEQTIERLKQVIDGYAPRLDFSNQGLPQAQTLPIIQQALRDEHDLDMTYWSAGRGVRTKRSIQPYRIEFKGKMAYLYAYCYQAHDERCFRLDRIEQIKIEPRGFAR